MSLLELPKAQALLKEAQVSAATVQGCRERLTRFLQRYVPQFYRHEQRELAMLVVEGRLSGLERKTSERIAHQAGRQRKPVQHFVGAGKWDDEAVMAELRRHVAEELGDPDGVMVVDGSAFPKKGSHSCGVARQWCGRLGKLDNCQVGVFLAYAAAGGYAPLDRCLYLPEDWAADGRRRRQTHVPKEILFQEKWRIALDLLARSAAAVPHGWITADDEFGRVAEFRAQLRWRRERYVVDVPCNTLVREIGGREPGGRRRAPFLRLDAWAAQQPRGRWRTLTIRDGEKGPLRARALKRRVQTKEEGGRLGPTETALVIRTMEKTARTSYALSNARRQVKLPELVRAKSQRHRIEELFEAGNGEVGLDHYEVRSWVGWHHHMTLSFLALWFLCMARRRVGGENTGTHVSAAPGDLQSFVTPTSCQPRPDRRGRHPSAAA